ncbi:MAG: ParB/RepB/Spo0J family partition protein, partial [Actinomycetes bacterium]
MSQKKRGLGRGLGALIPSGPESDRPVDVFFPSGEGRDPGSSTGPSTALTSDDDRSVLSDANDTGGRTSRRTASWDSALAGGRLSIRTGSDAPARDDGDTAV